MANKSRKKTFVVSFTLSSLNTVLTNFLVWSMVCGCCRTRTYVEGYR